MKETTKNYSLAEQYKGMPPLDDTIQTVHEAAIAATPPGEDPPDWAQTIGFLMDKFRATFPQEEYDAETEQIENLYRETLLDARRREPKFPKRTVHTTMGSPCSPKWDDDWIQLINKTEEELGSPCCGAHANELEPCTLEPSSKNGRCRFHGGAFGIGPKKGNANARIHGLYARRLQECGTHCPHWNTCAFAGPDVQSLPETRMPRCVYEQEELEALREMDTASHASHVDVIDRLDAELEEAPYPMLAQLVGLRENLHMLQIMMTRAASALAQEQLTTESIQQSDTYTAKSQKPGATLKAHQIITREYRLMMNTYSKFIKQNGLPRYERAG